MDVPWKFNASAGEVQGKCRESAVEVEAKVEVEVKSALRASFCGGSPRVEDPATLISVVVSGLFWSLQAHPM